MTSRSSPLKAVRIDHDNLVLDDVRLVESVVNEFLYERHLVRKEAQHPDRGGAVLGEFDELGEQIRHRLPFSFVLLRIERDRSVTHMVEFDYRLIWAPEFLVSDVGHYSELVAVTNDGSRIR